MTIGRSDPLRRGHLLDQCEEELQEEVCRGCFASNPLEEGLEEEEEEGSEGIRWVGKRQVALLRSVIELGRPASATISIGSA